MAENTNVQIQEDEITLKELILKSKDFFFEAVRSWKLILLLSVLFSAFMLYRAITEPVTFDATLSFMINEDEGNSLGAMGGLLGSIGIGVGGGSKYNLEKMLQLSRTRRIVQEILFEKIKIKDKEDFIANHIIDIYQFHDKWKDDTTGLKNFVFANNNFDQFKRFENKALKSVFRKVVGNPTLDIIGLLYSDISDETGIMKLKVSSESEKLSIDMVKIVYEKLSGFYIDKTIEKQQTTYTIVKAKVDSIRTLLQQSEYALADFKDSSLSLISKKAKLRELQLEAKIRMLYGMLAESTKNYEIADFSLKNKTPIIQIIDSPIAPIKPKQESKPKAIIIGAIIGGFIGLIYVFGRKIIRDAMKD